MNHEKTEVSLTVNGAQRTLLVGKEESLLDALRNASYMSVKYGCGDGTCGICTVLINGKPTQSCKTLASKMSGASIVTLEGLAAEGTLHPLQQAFMDTGAIQCGYCTPAQILSAKALLDANPNPSEDEIRKALNGVLCRCTGYVRLVEGVQRAAAMMRGEKVKPCKEIELPLPEDMRKIDLPEEYYRKDGGRNPLPPLVFTPKGMVKTKIVGKSVKKVDAKKLALGRPVYTDDVRPEGMLYGALLTSPHAHARIRRIDASKARALAGVHAVLTHHDIPRIKFASGGQSHPQPPPFDQVVLDDKVRHVGDRVAVVAAETPEIAQKALELIEVDYEVLPAVVDMEEAMKDGAPVIHDEKDTEGIYDAGHNIIHHVVSEVGEVDKAFAEAEHIFEGRYKTPKQQHVHMEPHVCITWLDDDDRLVVRTSTQVPFHVRRILAPLINMPVRDIRVIKPRIGGGFGNKQEMLVEDLCAHLTLATKRPVRLLYTRTQEFTASRSRHANIIHYKVALKGNKVTAMQLYLLGDTGAYAVHGLTVNMVGGFRGLTIYNPYHARFVCDVVYTNTPPAGACRGYGGAQSEYAIEVLMEEIAEQLGVDVVEFKRGNWIKVGDGMSLSREMGEGREGVMQKLGSSGMSECVDIGAAATRFREKRAENRSQEGRYRKGIGMAVAMHGTSIAGIDMAAATLKMNDDGSFNLLAGAADNGTGADTVLAQIAAEVLDIPIEDIVVYTSDTDFTPFDKGAYASSTTYLSGSAVRKAALEIKRQVLEHAESMPALEDASMLVLKEGKVVAADGRSVTLEEVALDSLHLNNQHQIMATASEKSVESPMPTAAQFAEVVVDTQTGKVQVERLLMVADCGRVVNPIAAAGQVEGGQSMSLGYSLTEEMLFDAQGQPLNASLTKYKIPRAANSPATDVMFVQTDEASGPFGAKSIGEVAVDGVAPAIASALHDATGVWMREIPYTPERVLAALKEAGWK